MDVKRLLGIIVLSLIIFMGCSSASDYTDPNSGKKIYKTSIRSDEYGAIASYTSWYSGIIIQADKNTLPENTDFILYERPSVEKESTVYGQAITPVYQFAPADSSKVILTILDKPLLIKIPNYYLNSKDEYTFLLGAKSEKSNSWEYDTIVPDVPYDDYSSRLSISNNSFFIIKTYRLNREFAVFASKKSKPDLEPDSDLFINDWKFLANSATCSVKIDGDNSFYNNDVNITTLATANKSELFDTYELTSEISFSTPNRVPVSHIMVDNKKVTEVISDSPIAINNQYLHTLKVKEYESSKKNVTANVGSFTFALNLKNVSTKEFPNYFNVKSFIKTKNNVVFASENQIHLNIVKPAKNASATILIEEDYVHMNRWLTNPVFVVDFGKTVAEDDRAGIIIRIKGDSDIIPETEWNSDFSKIICSLDTPLDSNKEYTIVMEGEAHDATKERNIIGNFAPFNFTTLENISVLMVNPLSDSTVVDVNSSVVLELSDEISWSESAKSCFHIYENTNEIALSAVDFDSATRRVTLKPNSPMKYQTNYRVSVKAGLKNNNRAQAASPIDFFFTTASGGIGDASAIINETFIYQNKYGKSISFNIDFGKDVADKNIASQSICLKNEQGDSLNLNKTWLDNRHMVAANANKLINGTEYKLIMESGVKSFDGMPITPFTSVDFKTIPLLTTTLTALDSDASGVFVDSGLKLEFSDEILWDDMNDPALISLSQNGIERAFTCDFTAPNSLLIKPTEALEPLTDVVVAIKGASTIVETFNGMSIAKKEMSLKTGRNMLDGPYAVGAGTESSPFMVGDTLVSLPGSEKLRLIGTITLDITELLEKFDGDVNLSQCSFKLSYSIHGYNGQLDLFENCTGKMDFPNKKILVDIPSDKLWIDDRDIDITLEYSCVASGFVKYFKTDPHEFITETGTELGPMDENSYYMVYTPAQLDNVRNLLSASYIQVRDINISPDNYQSANNTSAEGWKSLGTSSTSGHFTGTYDGGNRIISGLTIKRLGTTYCGLFNTCDGATLKNIIIKDGNIICGGNSGGLIGQCTTNPVNITNCKCSVNINSNGSNIGGIIGNPKIAITAEDIVYDGDIETTSNNVGGIFGKYETDTTGFSLTKAQVTGSIKGIDFIGGIMGYANQPVALSNCDVASDFVKGRSYIGGISGYTNKQITIQKCNSNSQEIGGAQHVGGIVGQLAGSYDCSIDNCNNDSNIVEIKDSSVTTSDKNFGGIVGDYKLCVVAKCTNKGNITVEGNKVGGILGYADGTGPTTIDSCENTGSIDGAKINIGGIAGYINATGTLKLCSNSGAINGTNNIGGICGNLLRGDLKSCKNTNKISGNTGIGGIAGVIQNSVIVDLCNNNGLVDGYTYVGGIFGGCNIATITNCINKSDVTAIATCTGGIGGASNYSKSESDCYLFMDQCLNEGYITAKGNVGGILGRAHAKKAGSVLQNSTNLGHITGTGDNEDTTNPNITNAAGIAGTLHMPIKSCLNKGNVYGECYGVGGIGGFSEVSADSCQNEGTITGKLAAAGLLGKAQGTINNSVNLGKVVAETEWAAGIVASATVDTKPIHLYNCYSIASIKSNGGGAASVLMGIDHDYGTANSCFTTTDSKLNDVNVSSDPAEYESQLVGSNATLTASYVFSSEQKFNPAATWNSTWNPAIWDNLEENILPTLKHCGYSD